MILEPPERIRAYVQQGWWGTETVLDLFRRTAARSPDALALVDPPNRADITMGEPRRVTYAEAAAEVASLAAALADAGVRKDDVVMVQLPNVVELVYVYLAAAWIGAAVSPLPLQYRGHEARQTMALVEPRALVTTQRALGFDHLALALSEGSAPGAPPVVIADGDDLPADVRSLRRVLAEHVTAEVVDETVAADRPGADDLLTICWTSGTETEPKGVPRSHNHWTAISGVLAECCGLAPGVRLLCPFPMVNMAGIGGFLVPWAMTGGTLVLHHPFALPTFLQQIAAERIEYTVAPPSLLSMLLASPLLTSADLSSLRCIGSGSAPLPPSMVSGWQERGVAVTNIFASNEGAILVSGPGDFPNPDVRARCFPRFGAPGLAWSSRSAAALSTRLVDVASGDVVDRPGAAGELGIKGPTVFPGYYRRPELTAQAFDADGYYRTGDLFEIDGPPEAPNLYRFVGRAREVISRGGFKIAPEEIEGLLTAHPKVAEVAVVGVAKGRLGEDEICAAVVPREGQTVELRELQRFLIDRQVASYKLPGRLAVVEALPRNPLGKVVRRELAQVFSRAPI